jgi:hypothetical protein
MEHMQQTNKQVIISAVRYIANNIQYNSGFVKEINTTTNGLQENTKGKVRGMCSPFNRYKY